MSETSEATEQTAEATEQTAEAAEQLTGAMVQPRYERESFALDETCGGSFFYAPAEDRIFHASRRSVSVISENVVDLL